MKKFNIFGNKKNLESRNGKIILSESMEREFKEIGIIKEDGIIEDEKGIKSPYIISDKEEEISRIYQFHKEKNQSFKIKSGLYNDIRYRMILFPKKGFNRIEIWKFPKGEKREMIFRNDKSEYNLISDKWKEISGEKIDIEEEIKNII